MTFADAIATAGIVTNVHVSKHTYWQLLVDLDHTRIDLNSTPSVASGLMANFAGIDIYMSALVADGQMALFNGDMWLGTVTLEATPAKPADPVVRVKRFEPDPDRTGVWKAFDADGNFLWHLTEEGARKLAARMDLDFP